jgi:hypothetical protein
MWFAEAGVAVAMPVTTTYSDYREVGGMRVPHRYIASTEKGGREIFQVLPRKRRLEALLKELDGQ